MLSYLKRRRLEIIVGVLIAIPICITAYLVRPKNETYIVVNEPTEEIIATVEIVEPTEELEPVDEEELELLARLINAEAGASWLNDLTRYYVGSVALNRVDSELFPDTLYEVIYQDTPCIQYACTVDGNIEKEPTERCYEIAEDLLRNGSVLPPDVIYQAEFEQGSGVAVKIDNMYFCYR